MNFKNVFSKKKEKIILVQIFLTSLGNRGWSDGARATYYAKSIFQHRHARIHWSRGLSDRCLWKNKFSSASNTNLRHFFLSSHFKFPNSVFLQSNGPTAVIWSKTSSHYIMHTNYAWRLYSVIWRYYWEVIYVLHFCNLFCGPTCSCKKCHLLVMCQLFSR